MDADPTRAERQEAGWRVRRSTPPWITLVVVVAAVLSGVMPGAAALLEYQRPRIETGEFWRLATSQAVHWSPQMAVADLEMVLLLGGLIESRSRRLLAATLVTATIVCGLGIHFLQPSLARYRGSSGIATAPPCALAVLLLRTGESRWARRAAGLGLALLLVKTMGEVMTGRALFAGEFPPGVEVTPMAHLVGALAGAAVAFALVRPSGAREAPLVSRP